MKQISFNSDQCRALDFSTQREWLETNGLGGFASSTIVGLNTRRYHGLLVAATKPPVGRMVLLAKLEATLVVGEKRFELSANQYPGLLYPQGFHFQQQFRLDPFPVFTYECDGVVIEKSLLMVHGENATVVEYRLLSAAAGSSTDIKLELRPLLAYRDYHSLTHLNSIFRGALDVQPNLISISPYEGCPTLSIAHNANALTDSSGWYFRFQYERERERGLDFEEDLFNSCCLTFNLESSPATLIAATRPFDIADASVLREQETARRREIIDSSPSPSDFAQTLTLAADQFVVRRGENQTIIAGYHWFADWGRDTMIALPGLAIATGRFDVARSILSEFAGHVDQGMIPNHFPDAGEAPEYNTVDATLWYFEAVRSLLEATRDFGFVREHLYDALKGIIDWHVRGTRYGIRVDADGLLLAGEPGVQLTWMDAKIGDWVVTPRHGKPVEIEALWYNALRIMQMLATEFGETISAKTYRKMADAAKVSFNRQFWNESAGCLYDVIGADGGDRSIRPNQIFAVSLTHSMLTKARAAQVVEVVERELLTPVGLRTLSPFDRKYRPRYAGDAISRDSTYHQGTVWPWLLGPFVLAFWRVNGPAKKSVQRAMAILAGLESHLEDAGLGQISEICDAEAPFAAKGCIAQAWSVGELLRALALLENVDQSPQQRKTV